MNNAWIGLSIIGCLILSLNIRSAEAAPLPEDKQSTYESSKEGTDCYGDALPPGTFARLGSLRFRHFASSVAVSPDGERLASAGNGQIKVWEATTGKELLRINDRSVHSVVFSPTGKILASDNREDDTVNFWDAATGASLLKMPERTSAAFFSPDDRTFMTRFWKYHYDKSMKVPAGTIVCGFSEGKRIGNPCLCDSASGKIIRSFEADCELMSVSPNGKLLATSMCSAMKDEQKIPLILWDTATGIKLHTFDAPRWKESYFEYEPGKKLLSEWKVIVMAFSPDSKTLVVGTKGCLGECCIVLWDVNKGEQLLSFGRSIKYLHSFAFSPDGKILASVCNYQIVLSDVQTGKELRSLQGHFNGNSGAVISPDGKTLYSCGGDSVIRSWNTATGEEIILCKGHDQSVTAVDFSPDGKTVISHGKDRTIRCWDPITGKQRHQVTAAPPSYAMGQKSLAISPDGNYFILAGKDNYQYAGKDDYKLFLSDLKTGKQLRELSDLNTDFTKVAFSPDGKTIAAGGCHDYIGLWDADSGKIIRKFAAYEDSITNFAFSADGTILAAGTEAKLQEGETSRRRLIRFWNTATGKEIRKLIDPRNNSFPKHDSSADLTFSPDDRILAVSGDSDVVLWDLVRDKEILIAKDMRFLAFSPDGKSFALACDQKMIHLWETTTMSERFQYEGHEANVTSLAFSPDGKSMASGSHDTTILVWDIFGLTDSSRLRKSQLSNQEYERIWADLGTKDAAKAFQYTRTLVSSSEKAASFLRKDLQPISTAEMRRIASLIGDLDNDQHAVRAKATGELESLKELAAPALRQALKTQHSLESRRRIEHLLDRLKDPSPERLRTARAIEVLEYIGSPEVRQLLETLAQGAPEAYLTQEAKSSLKRLSHRSISSP